MDKIGLICLGHNDYLDENLYKMVDEIKENLYKQDICKEKIQTFATNSDEAIAGAREMIAQECNGVILLLASWVECRVAMSAIKELEHIPVILWGTPMVEIDGSMLSTGSYVSAAMLNGMVNRLALPCTCLIGSYRDPTILQALKSFAVAARAVRKLRYSTVGLIGYSSMGIYPGTFDHLLMRYCIGPEIDQADSYTIINKAQGVDAKAIENAGRRLAEVAELDKHIAQDSLRRTLALYVAMKKLCEERQWDALNVKCQYEFSKEYKTVPCVAISLLADDGIVTSCEGDVLNTVSMLLLNLLTGATVTYGDAITHWENTVKFSACGFLPFSMGCGTKTVKNFMEHPGFAGIQPSFVMRPGRVTFLRLVEDIGSYHIVYGTGQGLETMLRDGCMPAIDVTLDGDIKEMVKAYAGQHFALCYGDVSAEIEAFAVLMGIKTLRI